jgi:hypothetical protein
MCQRVHAGWLSALSAVPTQQHIVQCTSDKRREILQNDHNVHLLAQVGLTTGSANAQLCLPSSVRRCSSHSESRMTSKSLSVRDTTMQEAALHGMP